MNDDLLAAFTELERSLAAFRLTLTEFAVLQNRVFGQARPGDAQVGPGDRVPTGAASYQQEDH